MFDYCTTALGYSESAANLRIRAARCLARFPEVYGMLEANQVNPSTLSQVAKILTPENRNDVLARIRGKSQRAVEAIVAEYDARAALPRDRVRTVVVRVPAKEAVAPVSGEPSPVTDPTPPARNDCQEIYRCNSGVFDPPSDKPAVDCFLEKEDPAARQDRREERRQKGTGQTPGEKTTAGPQEPRRGKYSVRHIPAHVRDQVFLRDKGRCTYAGPDGRRCGSAYVLQIDHITPVARGGAGTMDNLRLLCAHHNRLEAEHVMGPAGGRGAT